MRQVRCIKECVMENTGEEATTLGKVYDVIYDYGDCFSIEDDQGMDHTFTAIGEGYTTGDEEYFEEVEE